MQYFETSSKQNINVDELMQYMMETVYNKLFVEPEDRGTSIVIGGKKAGDKSGNRTNANTSCCS